MGRLLGHAPGHVPLDALPGRRPQPGAGLGHPLLGDAGRRRIRVGIHAVGAGQDALEGGEAAHQGLPRLLGHAHRGVDEAQADFLGGGAAVLLGTEDDEEIVVLAGRTRLRRRSRMPCLSGNSGIAAPLSTMGASSRQAMTRTRPRSSSRKVVSGCVGCWARPATPSIFTA